MGHLGDLGKDTGYDELAASRLVDGELPYVDFTYFYGPLAPVLLAGVYFLGGTGLGAAVGFGLALALGIVAATYAVGRSLAGPWGGLLAAGITAPLALAPTNFSYVTPHTYSAPLAILLTLGFLFALGRYAGGGTSRWLVAAGWAAGLISLTRPEFELAVVAAGAAWLMLRARRGLGGRRELLRFAVPAVAVPAVVYGIFAVLAGPRDLVFANLYPTDFLDAGANAVLRIHAPLTFASFAELGLKLVLYAAGAAALLLVARVVAESDRYRAPLVGALGAAAAVVLALSVIRPEALRHGLEFAYAWIPAGAALGVVLLVRRALRREREWDAQAQLTLAATIVLAVLAAKTYGAFLLHAPRPQPAVYAVPFAAVLLARLHLVELPRRRLAVLLGAAWLAFLTLAGAGLTLKDAADESVTVTGAAGRIAETPAEASVFQAALDLIERQTLPGDAILVGPQLTALYVLADRANPLEQLTLVPGSLAAEGAEQAAIERLERSDVRLAVLDRREFPEYGHTSFGGSFDAALAAWIRDNFDRTATLSAGGPRTLDIWLRRRT